MVPIWLTAPPNGLSDAERRALEAFFVAEEVKIAADLLSLSPKTIQNELLLARQTMGESKSWMAAIRYVFYVKRQGYGFVEEQLVPKIERQIRRLIDDYLESTETSDSASAPISEPVASSSDAPPSSQGGRFDIVNAEFVEHDLVPVEQFERQLDGLIRCAAVVYERPARRRRTRFVTALAVAGLAMATVWGIVSRTSPQMSQEETLTAEVETLVSGFERVRTAHSASSSECAALVDRLCNRYWLELWGPREKRLIDRVFKPYHAEIESGTLWAAEHDRALALQIFGNGHRGFFRGGVLASRWPADVQKLVDASAAERGLPVVRALCAVIYASANGIQGPLSPTELAGFRDKATERLGGLLSTLRGHDLPNARRHIGLTQAMLLRSECVVTYLQAKREYEAIGDERSKWGVGQCLFSLAECGDSLPTLKRIEYGLAALKVLKEAQNEYSIVGCLEQVRKDSVVANPSTLADKSVLLASRTALGEEAQSLGQRGDDANQFEFLVSCLTIDAKVAPRRLGEDVQALVISKQANKKDPGTRNVLAGFAYANLPAVQRSPLLEVVGRGRDGSLTRFHEGRRLKVDDVLKLVKEWPSNE